MTFLEPTVIVERMRIERDAASVYDEPYHVGVNVIRGDNSSGKSTILNFLFYGLGGDLTDWSSAAQLCSRVLVQVRINGKTATLAREVSAKPRRSMDIFAGAISEALESPVTAWWRFGYSRTESKESFSQALFRLMNIPEVATDTSGNITINQLLRILYADQLSPVENIFKYQGIFDNADIRDAIGRLVFGAHSMKYYDNEQEIRRLDKEYLQLTGEYRSLLSVLEGEDGITWEWVQSARAKLMEHAAAVAGEIERTEREISGNTAKDAPTLRAQEAAYAQVVELQQALGEAQERKTNLALKIADSDRFIRALRAKLQELNDSSLVANVIGDVRFNECPACQAPMEDDPAAHACYLCKSPYDEEQRRGRLTALITDTALQISQSEQLQRSRFQRSANLDGEIQNLTHRWQAAAGVLAELRSSPNSERQLRLRELNREAGYISRQLEDLSRKEQLAGRLQELSERRAAIQGAIQALLGENEALEREQLQRISYVSTAVSDEIKTLLRNDLRRQDVFENPSSVAVSFRENSISVNDERYFSASSRAILKSSFVLGLLATATKIPYMRHPRMCMIDTLENMGVESVRSQNFQRQILRVSESSEVEHQIIFATAMISEEIDKQEYIVGRHYTRDHPSLSFSS
jgi:hypothetical protein